MSGERSCQNNFAMGKYSPGNSDQVEDALDGLRKEAEYCESLQGIQVISSRNGGCGSGLGSKLLDKAKDLYPGPVFSHFSIVPSKNVCENILEPYNFTLSRDPSASGADMNFFYDNETLYGLCQKTQKITHPSFGDHNAIVAATINDFSIGTRFPGAQNANPRKLLQGAVPWPGVNIFSVSYGPLFSYESTKYTPATTQMLRE